MTTQQPDISQIGLTPVRATLIVVGIIVLAWFMWSWREAHTVHVDRRTLSSPDVPPEFDGARLVFAADIHAGPLFGPVRVRELVAAIEAEEPDIVVLGGDYVGGRHGGARAFYPEISRLDAEHGVFAVLGNHDVWEGVDDARSGFEAAGIALLENELARIDRGDDSLVIAGLEDEWTGSPDGPALASKLEDDDFAILVAHNPDSFDAAIDGDDNRWGLALAGHTHGGQVRGAYAMLLHKPTRFGDRFLGGWSDEHGTPVLVSNGVGSVTLPLRTLAPAQIHVITLERSSG